MAIQFASIAVCSICGEPLNAKGDCLACLIRAGLDESATETKPLVSLVFGDFEIEQRADGFYWELGHGAMGVTYLAMDKVLRRRVALKVIDVPEAARTSQAVRDRFLREARAAAALRHPNVAAVFQFGASPDASHCYYAMELVEGETLEARVRRDGPLDAEPVLEIAIQITRALIAADARGLIHRDLKPGNIMLTGGNAATTELEVKVIDFGLAKAIANAGGEMDLTHEGFVGTPTFASPEQFGSCPVDARSDIYSLGATLWFALTGLAPRSGNTIEEIRDRHTHDNLPVEQLVARKVPEPIIKLLCSTLAADPSKRPASARELMEALESCRRKVTHGMGSFYKLAALILVAVIAAGAYFMLRLNHRRVSSSATSSAPLASTVMALPEKSIAVLPLENMSDEKENALFADGIHDELLSNLSKIKELKVISRTSVMQYKSGITHNLKELAQQLGVNNIVEGTVRRSGNHVRVSVQLIDAKTDSHVWGQNYDGTLADSLTLQGELATEIAAAVGATLSPQEKARVTAKPTNNTAAYDAYLRGRVFASEENDLEKALLSYRKAVELDPNFVLAWARLSSMQSQAHWQIDSSPERLAAAKAGIDHALALDPNLPEVHLALGYYRYYVERDFAGAVAELRQAEQALPNDTDVIKTIAFIQRRRGQWDEALTGLHRAVELDPRDIDGYNNLALTYEALRRFPEALATFDRASTWEPANFDCNCAWDSLGIMRANALLSIGKLQDVGAGAHESAYTIGFIRAAQPLLQGRYADAKDILSKALADESRSRNEYSTGVEEREILLLVLGLTQQRAGDVGAARATYQQVVQDARHGLESVSPSSPGEAEAHANMGWAYAGLGEAESAIAEGLTAMSTIPSSKDAYRGPKYEENMARIYALLGDADHAIPILKRLLRIPYWRSLTPAKLRIDPTVYRIRNDPRFQELIVEKTS
jgi:serine/threonine protein kinase/Tfp pilus assembly protein PilF